MSGSAARREQEARGSGESLVSRSLETDLAVPFCTAYFPNLGNLDVRSGAGVDRAVLLLSLGIENAYP
jgi:hypothetical protein